MKKSTTAALVLCAGLLACTNASAQEEAASADNGTNPTKFTTIAEGKYEYLDLGGGLSSEILRLSYTQPLGEGRYSIRARLPISAVDVFGDNSYGIGDFSVEVAHVFGLSRKGAFVAKGELAFDTAERPELGTGRNVFKGTLIYASFLEGGDILAPAIVHSVSIWGDHRRADVNSTTVDFYYVPKLSNSRNLITYDPALNFDWESNKKFANVAVTFGRVLGPQWGGRGILFIKPSLFAGGDRPSQWGLEVGYKVIAF